MAHHSDRILPVPNKAHSPQIRRAPGIRLTQIEGALLRRAFAQSHSLFVEREFRSGYSGALVLLVSVDSGAAPLVVKIAPLHDLQREYDAYHHYVLPSAPQNSAQLQGPPLAESVHDTGILIYTFAGGDPRRPSNSLGDFYKAQGGEAAGALLNRVFRSYGRHWWATNRPHKFVLDEYYDHLLPVHLELVLQPTQGASSLVLRAGDASIVDLRGVESGQHVRLLNFRVAKVKHDEGSLTLTGQPPAGEASAPLRLRIINAPLDLWRVGERVERIDAQVVETRTSLLRKSAEQALAEVAVAPLSTEGAMMAKSAALDIAVLLQPLAELEPLLERVVEARFSTIHGDLNLNNLLVDMATGFAWLIDFADTRHGPTLYDLQRLEVQVIIKLLPELLRAQRDRTAAQQMVVLAQLLNALHADPPSPLAPDVELQEPYVLLTHLRRLARQYLMDDLEWDEYFLGLIIALLGALKFDELDALARSLVLAAASTLYELLGVAPRRLTAATLLATEGTAPLAHPAPFTSVGVAAVAAPMVAPPPEPIRPPRVDIFVGREAELADFAEQLKSTRFAVISGMAGVGKTALAATLTEWISTAEKVFWHSFHEGDGINTIVWKLAAFLAYRGQVDLWRLLETARQTSGQPPPIDTLVDYLLQLLHTQNVLLCFDDFHLVEDDPAFEQFFSRLRQVTTNSALMLLMTTRRLPDFVPQAEFAPLQGLQLADTQRLLSLRGLQLEPSVQKELHLRTDGNAQFLMLAINVLQQAVSPVHLLERLAETDDVERYLLNRVDEGLSGQERSVMSAVSILMGQPGGRNAIEFVLNAGSVWRTLRLLQERHLLTVTENESERLYSQHAIVQAFYYQGLARRQQRTMHRRAAEYYATEEQELLRSGVHYERAAAYELAARQATADVWSIINRGQARALRQLLEQLRAEQLPPEQWAEVQIAQGVNDAFLNDREAANQHFQSALANLAHLPLSARVQQLKAKACLGMAELLELETPEDALTWLEKGLTEAADLDDPVGAALQIKIGTARLYLGRYDEARAALEKGLAQLSPNPSQLRSIALTNLGSVNFFQGNLAQAQTLQQQALAISQQLHDQFRSVNILSNLAINKFCRGDWAAAIDDFSEALRLAEALGSEQLQAEVAINLGAAYINTGSDEEAERHLQKSLQLAKENSFHVIETFAQLRMADLHIRLGDWAAASIYLASAEAVARTISHQGSLIAILRYWAEIKLAEEDAQAAFPYVQSSLDLAAELAERMERGEGLRVLGAVLQRLDQHQQALAAFEESLQILIDEDPYQAARTLVVMGRFLLEEDEPLRGKALLEEASSIFTRLGARRDLTQLGELS